MSESAPAYDAPPRHAFEVTIRAGACDWNVLLRELQRLTIHVEQHGPECALASGGGGSSSSIRIERREISEADYNDELSTWCNRQRRAADSQPSLPLESGT